MNNNTPALTVKLTARLARVLPAAYELDANVPTGGGCRAMVVTAPDRRTCYLTNGDADLPGADDSQTLLLGYYDADDEEAGVCTLEGGVGVDIVENAAVFLMSWVQGDPYLDVE